MGSKGVCQKTGDWRGAVRNPAKGRSHRCPRQWQHTVSLVSRSQRRPAIGRQEDDRPRPHAQSSRSGSLAITPELIRLFGCPDLYLDNKEEALVVDLNVNTARLIAIRTFLG